jgi:probable rRNA maturation factor
MVTVRKMTHAPVTRAQVGMVSRAAREALAVEGAEEKNVCVVMADAPLVRDLNRRFAGRDEVTDVLAFEQGGEELGDVVVCVPAAMGQAKVYGHTLTRELMILAAHGVLHLVGWRDKTDSQRRKMMRRTEEIVSRVEARTKS